MLPKNRTLKAGLDHLLTNGNQKIVFGALKKLNIRPYQPDFEDFLQEARLTYARAYVRFPQNPASDLKEFRVFAYQAIYWRTLNLLKRQTMVKNWQTAELSTNVTNLPRQYRCSSREQQVFSRRLISTGLRNLYASGKTFFVLPVREAIIGPRNRPTRGGEPPEHFQTAAKSWSKGVKDYRRKY